MNGKFTKAMAMTAVALIVAGAGFGTAYAVNQNVRDWVNGKAGVVEQAQYDEKIEYSKMLEDRIIALNGQVDGLNSALITEKNLVRSKENSILLLREEKANLEDVIGEKNYYIDNLNNNIRTLNYIIDERNSTIHSLRNTIEHISSSLANCSRTITTLNTIIEEKNKLIRQNNDLHVMMSSSYDYIYDSYNNKILEIRSAQEDLLSESVEIENASDFVFGKYYNIANDMLVEVLDNGLVIFYEDEDNYQALNYTVNGTTITVDIPDEDTDEHEYWNFDLTSNMSFNRPNENNSDFIYVNENIESLITEYRFLLNEFHSTCAQLQALESENQEHLQVVASTTAERDNLQTEVDTLNNQIEELTATISNYESQITALNASLSQVQSQYNTAVAEKEELEQQLAVKDAEIATLNTQLEVLQARVTELEQQVADLRAELKNYQTIQRNIDDMTITFDGFYYWCSYYFAEDLYSFNFFPNTSFGRSILVGLDNSRISAFTIYSLYQASYTDSGSCGFAFVDKTYETINSCFDVEFLPYEEVVVPYEHNVSVVINGNNSVNDYDDNAYFDFIDFNIEVYTDDELDSFAIFASENSGPELITYYWADGSVHHFDEFLSGNVVKSLTANFTTDAEPISQTTDAGAGSATDSGDGADLGD